MIGTPVIASLLLAALPAFMTWRNLVALRGPVCAEGCPSIAVLIPARNEEATISDCIRAALACMGVDLEVIVLDDDSSDRTASIVTALARDDQRLRLVQAPTLPPGWNGKQHACWVLSQQTQRPLMLYIDADVRLRCAGPARLAAALQKAQVDLVSAVPQQLIGGWAEALLIPMINMLILGYLPVQLMRRKDYVGLAAGCGQVMMVRRLAYVAAGGHAAIRASLHDGLKLPRQLRRRGFRTDMVEGTSLATCRMYRGVRELLPGLLKNATEGMASPRALPVWTLLLGGGHVLPWVLLAFSLFDGRTQWLPALLTACLLPMSARLAQAIRYREPIYAVLLHPVGVLVLLMIQWVALLRSLLGLPAHWRGRTYRPQM